MIHINLLPKRKEGKTVLQMENAISGNRKLIQWHSDNIIELQKQQIHILERMLRLYGMGINREGKIMSLPAPQ